MILAAALLAGFVNPVAAQSEPSPPSEIDGSDPRPAAANPAELNKCMAACRAGGRAITAYCSTMPSPQLKAMCHAAAAAGEVSCYGFCYARFVD